MKIKFLPLVVALFAATSIMTSCLNNDVEQITYTSETSITGFSLGTLHIDRVGKDQNGQDSAYVDTLNCADYPFTINQMTREIENKDSLPYGTHIDKVITNITYDAGALGYRPKGAEHDTVWTSTDSIDFTEPVEFRVYAYSGAIGKAYTIKVNVHQQVPDTLAWKQFDNAFSAGTLSEQKAVYANGKVFVLGKTEAMPISNIRTWQTTIRLRGLRLRPMYLPASTLILPPHGPGISISWQAQPESSFISSTPKQTRLQKKAQRLSTY